MAHTIGSLPARASSAVNPITFAQAILAGETVLALMLKIVGATDRTGGAPSWGSLVLQQANTIQKAAASPEAGCELWYLVNPPLTSASDSRTLTIPNAGALTIFYQVALGRAAAGRGSEFNAAAGANNTAANPSPGSVNCEAGDIAFAITSGGWTTWAPSAQAGTVISNNDDGADGGGTQYALRGTAGAFTLDWTFGTSDDWGAIAATFRERPAHTFNNFMGVDGASGMSVGERIR